MRDVWRWLVRLVLSLLVIAVLGGAWLVWTSPGRDVLARAIERFASSRIPGSMKIGKLESVGLLSPVGRDVEFFTPAGERVLHVDRAHAQWNLAEILEGTIVFYQARADGGEVVIAIDDEGRTNMEDAFEKDREDKPALDLENMHLENMTVLVLMSGETRFIVRDVQGFVSVWRRDTPGVRVSLGRIRGTFEEPEIAGDKIELLDLDGEVWAGEDHIVSMAFKTRIGHGRLDANFDYYDREKNAAELKLRPETGPGARPAAIEIAVRSLFSDKLSVTIEK
jgi:hypothetical protein